MMTRSMAKSRMSTKVESLEGSLGESINTVVASNKDEDGTEEIEEELVNVCGYCNKDDGFLVIDECELLAQQCPNDEYGHFSAVESGYKEPPTYKSMLRRPREEREKWIGVQEGV